MSVAALHMAGSAAVVPVTPELSAELVSAGAKIPIVPVEKSPTPGGDKPPRFWKQRRDEMCSGAKTWNRSTNSNGKG
jgi:hypothetical protein